MNYGNSNQLNARQSKANQSQPKQREKKTQFKMQRLNFNALFCSLFRFCDIFKTQFSLCNNNAASHITVHAFVCCCGQYVTVLVSKSSKDDQEKMNLSHALRCRHLNNSTAIRNQFNFKVTSLRLNHNNQCHNSTINHR